MKSSTVVLRQLKESDASALFTLVDGNRPQLRKFWWEARTQSVNDSRDFIRAALTAERYYGRPTRGVFVGDVLVGVASVHTIDWQNKSAAIGYWIGEEYAAKGYATQAAVRLSKTVFKDLRLDSIAISCRATNHASRTVAEKAGFILKSIDTEQHWRTHVDTLVKIAHYELVKTAR